MQKILEAEVEHLKLKVGLLDVDLNECGFGKILLDGKDFPVTSMTVEIVAGEVTKVRMVAVFYPIKTGDEADKPTLIGS